QDCGEIDVSRALIDGGRLYGGNLMLPKYLAHNIEPTRQRRVTKALFRSPRSIPADRCGERGLLRWSAEDLAREASLGLATIKRAEGSEKETSMTAANDLTVRRTLESAGVEFIDENGGGPGVRLRKRQQKKN